MKPLRAAIVVVLVACSTSSNHAGPPATDAGPTVESGPMDGAPVLDAQASYEQAVLAAAWATIPNAPLALAGGKMDDIYFPSPLVGYAVSGAASTIYKTSDGGKTWATSYTHTGTYFRSVLFVDDDNGFASNLGAGLASTITDTNVLYNTKDGGMTWTPVTSITGPMPGGICNQTKIDATHLVAVGRVEGPAFFMSSSDGGATWTSKDLSAELAMLIDARFTTPTDGIVIGGTAGANLNCTVLATHDGGSTWQTAFTSATANTICWKISFPSAQVGYASVQDASGGPPTFIKTADGGQTWIEKPLPNNKTNNYTGIGIGFITENVGWVSADYDQNGALEPTYRTTDGGETWTPDPTLKSPINRFRFLDMNNAYAIGGAMWKLNIAWTGGEL